jgi:16S rRNA (uracil1498-N3)-methyltransferase
MAVRAPVSCLEQGERELGPDTSVYLIRVLRLGQGDRFLAFDPDAKTEADATVLEAKASAARVRIENVRPGEVLAKIPLALVYALAKGDKVDAVVRDATELGATKVILARTARSVVKIDHGTNRAASKLERLSRVAAQAARQSGRVDPPLVDGIFEWRDALERAGDCEARFCLDPRAREPIGAALGPAILRGASIAFAIGPEGGLSTEEVDRAREEGFVIASLGPFILRTETVAAAVLGAVRVLSGLQ